MAEKGEKAAGGAAQQPPRRKLGVQPNVLQQFYDTPAAASQRPARGSGNQQQQTAPGYFGSSKRTDLTDAQVVLATPEENGKLGGAFGRADFKNDINLPRTEAQRILQRDSYDRKPDEIFVVVPEHYTIAGVVPPTNKVLKVPQIDNPFLMTPQQRREFSEFELKQREAVKIDRTARSDRTRMLGIMKTSYPNGVIGMESVEPKYGERTANPYADKVQQAAASHERAVQAQEARKGNIVTNSDGLQRRGYTFLQQTGDAPPQGAIAARKAPGAAQPQLDTHARLFERNEWTHNPARAEVLRQHDTRGKNYDLITGVAR